MASDVAILFPLPDTLPFGDPSESLVAPSEQLDRLNIAATVVSRTTFARVVPKGSLDPEVPSTFDDLRIVAVRLDGCAVSYPQGSSDCKPELRAVVQGVHTDPQTGLATVSDGALHISYSASVGEITNLASWVRSERLARSLEDRPLGVHPILESERLAPSGGPFATVLRARLKPMLADSRISKITVYDHENDAAVHQWTFSVFSRTGALYQQVPIPTLTVLSQVVKGTDPHALLEEPFASLPAGPGGKDPVAGLVAEDRPAPKSSDAMALGRVFESAIRVENPAAHTGKSTDCVNCHLAEGARRIGESRYGFNASSTSGFGAQVPHRDDRTSLTNLHAFGYLGREVSIMQRAAAEATVTAKQLTSSGI